MGNHTTTIFGSPLKLTTIEIPVNSSLVGVENKLALDDRDLPGVQVKHSGRLFAVHLVHGPEDYHRLAAVNTSRWLGEPETGARAQRDTDRAGKTLYLTSSDGMVVAMASISTAAHEPPSPPTDNDAVLYGIAVMRGAKADEHFQVMIKALHIMAREEASSRMVIAVSGSLLSLLYPLFRSGFRLVDNFPTGPHGLGAHATALQLEKRLMDEPFPFESRHQTSLVARGDVPITPHSGYKRGQSTQPVEVGAFLPVGRTAAALATIQDILHAGYIGIGVLPHIHHSARDSGLLIFHRRDAAPVPEASQLPIQIKNEFGRLREVIVGHSTDTASLTSETAINAVAQANIGNIDSIAMRDEHEAFIEALQAEGVGIVHTCAHGIAGRTAIFTRDPAFVIGNTFVVGRLARETREYETHAMELLSRSNLSRRLIAQKQKDIILEGGDVILLNDSWVAVGLGQRSTEAGLLRLVELFPNHNVVGVRHSELHLDVLFTVLGEKAVLADTSRLPPDFVDFIRSLGYTVVAANPREQVTLGCNVLAIDDNAVISVAENGDTNQSLRDSGIRVVEVSMPNIIKEGGGPRCLTCPTHRD